MRVLIRLLFLATVSLSLVVPPAPAEARKAGTVYRAVKKKVSAKFASRGVQRPRRSHAPPGKKVKDHRFGNDGDYYAMSSRRALAESSSSKRLTSRTAVKRAGTRVDMYTGHAYRKAMRNRVNVNSLSNSQLKRMTGLKSLRGARHNGVLGPAAGKRLGKWAYRHKRVLRYQPRAKLPGEKSTRGKWGNIYVPYSLRPPNASSRGAAVSKLSRTW